MSPVLQAWGITRRFGGLAAVSDVDICVEAGEIVGLIGPNGSGKTTLFDCLSRVEGIDAGSISLNGKDITDAKPHNVAQLGLSRTFQQLRVYEELTVLENMELSIQWRNVGFLDAFRRPNRRTTERADQLIELLLLSRLRNERAAKLSGGQLRLLELGMALMPDPSIVLLDEAMAGVNPSLVEEIKNRIRLLNEEHGVSFLIVEHDTRLVKDLCSRLVVLDYGRKLAEGSVDEIMTNENVIEAYFGAPADDPSRISGSVETSGGHGGFD